MVSEHCLRSRDVESRMSLTGQPQERGQVDAPVLHSVVDSMQIDHSEFLRRCGMTPYFELRLFCEDWVELGRVRHYKLMNRMANRTFALASGFGNLGALGFERSLKWGIDLAHKACGRHYPRVGARALVMVVTGSRFHSATSFLAMDVSESRFQNDGTGLEKASIVDHRWVPLFALGMDVAVGLD